MRPLHSLIPAALLVVTVSQAIAAEKLIARTEVLKFEKPCYAEIKIVGSNSKTESRSSSLSEAYQLSLVYESETSKVPSIKLQQFRGNQDYTEMGISILTDGVPTDDTEVEAHSIQNPPPLNTLVKLATVSNERTKVKKEVFVRFSDTKPGKQLRLSQETEKWPLEKACYGQVSIVPLNNTEALMKKHHGSTWRLCEPKWNGPWSRHSTFQVSFSSNEGRHLKPGEPFDFVQPTIWLNGTSPAHSESHSSGITLFTGPSTVKDIKIQTYPIQQPVPLKTALKVATLSSDREELAWDVFVRFSENEPEPEQFVLNFAADGSYTISEQNFSPQALPSTLRNFALQRPKPALVIRASPDTKFAQITKILEACKSAGLENVAFANAESK